MANIIATEALAKSIGGSSASVTSNLMVTRVRAVALGCSIRNSYSDKQLVCLKDLYRVYCTGDCDNHQYACNVVGCVGDCSNCSCQSTNCTCNATCDCTGGHWSSLYCSCDTTCDCTGGYCSCHTTCSCTSTCNCTTTGCTCNTACNTNTGCTCTSTCNCTNYCTCNKYTNSTQTCMSEFCLLNDPTSDPQIQNCGCDGNWGSCALNSAYPCGINLYDGCYYYMAQGLSCWDSMCLPIYADYGNGTLCGCYSNNTCYGKVISCSCHTQCTCVSANCSCESECACNSGNCKCQSGYSSCTNQCDCESECTGNCSNCQPNACVGDCSGNHLYSCKVVGCVEDGKGSTYKCTCHTTCDCTGGHWSSLYCSCDNTCSCQTACSNCPSNNG